MSMKAREIMSQDPRAVTPEMPVQQAAKLMKDEDVGILPVVEDNSSKRLIGVITDRDIAIRVVADGANVANARVRDAMSSGVKAAKPDDEVSQIMDLMGREQVRRVPIVDARGTLVGIVAQADIVLKAKDDAKAERTVEQISEPGGRHQQ
jgi:CBS domain-containing protein